MVANSYRGCTHLADTALAFDALAAEVGMTPRVTFMDVTIAALGPAPSLAVAPWCHAVIYAVTTAGHGRSRRPVDEDADADADAAGPNGPEPPVIRLRAELAQIPDVYAFLHAVFNCNIPKAMVPDSAIDRLRSACSEQPLGHRHAVLRKAAELQRAYRKTVCKAPWGLASPGAAASSAAVVTLASTPRYFVFVRSPVSGSIYLIDGDRLSEIEPARPPERTSSVLTENVLAKLGALHEAYGAGEAFSVTGILERLC